MSHNQSKSLHRLGRGLESMFGKSFVGGGRSVIEIPVKDVSINAYQPRKVFDEAAMKKLAHSIRQNGLAQPVLVRPLDEGGYELIAGERRWRACQLAGFKSIPAIVKQVGNLQSLQLALVENLDREDLTVLEEAAGYQRLIVEFNYTHKALADLFGKSRSAISNILRLLNLPEYLKEALRSNVISEGHARLLLPISDDTVQQMLFDSIKKDSLSVRQLEKKISTLNQSSVVVDQLEIKQASTSTPLPVFDSLTKEFKSKGVVIKCTGTESKGKISFSYSSEDELKKLSRILGGMC